MQISFAVFFDVPTCAAFGAFAAFVALLPVLLFHFRRLEGIGDAHGVFAACACVLHGGDQHVFQGDFCVFNLATARLTNRQLNLGQVFAA